MKITLVRFGLIILCTLFLSSHASALTIKTWTHDSGSTPADYQLNVSNSGGNFNFALNVINGTNADLLGFYFNVKDDSSDYMPGMIGDTVGSLVSICGYNTSNCGKGNNLNGLPIKPWDVALQIGTNGSSGGSITSAMFSLPKLGLGLGDLEYFGVRAQSTGSGNGSDKAFAPVPIPAAFWLFGSGLLGLFAWTKRKALT